VFVLWLLRVCWAICAGVFGFVFSVNLRFYFFELAKTRSSSNVPAGSVRCAQDSPQHPVGVYKQETSFIWSLH
jgi:hypothetical protein